LKPPKSCGIRKKLEKDIRNGEINGIAAGGARPLFIFKIGIKRFNQIS